MMNCFCGMVHRQKAFSLISSWDHCQRFSPSSISNMLQAGVAQFAQFDFFHSVQKILKINWVHLSSSTKHIIWEWPVQNEKKKKRKTGTSTNWKKVILLKVLDPVLTGRYSPGSSLDSHKEEPGYFLSLLH